MGTFSIWHWIIVLVVVLLLFGAGKIPRLMGDVAKGVKAFKKGLAEDEEPGESGDRKKLEGDAAPTSKADATPADDKKPAEKKKDEAANG